MSKRSESHEMRITAMRRYTDMTGVMDHDQFAAFLRSPERAAFDAAEKRAMYETDQAALAHLIDQMNAALDAYQIV